MSSLLSEIFHVLVVVNKSIVVVNSRFCQSEPRVLSDQFMLLYKKKNILRLCRKNPKRISFQYLFDWRNVKFFEINKPIQSESRNKDNLCRSLNCFVGLALRVRVIRGTSTVVDDHLIGRILSWGNRTRNWKRRNFVPRMAPGRLHLSGFNVRLRKRNSIVAAGNASVSRMLLSVNSVDPSVLCSSKHYAPISVRVLVCKQVFGVSPVESRCYFQVIFFKS